MSGILTHIFCQAVPHAEARQNQQFLPHICAGQCLTPRRVKMSQISENRSHLVWLCCGFGSAWLTNTTCVLPRKLLLEPQDQHHVMDRAEPLPPPPPPPAGARAEHGRHLRNLPHAGRQFGQQGARRARPPRPAAPAHAHAPSHGTGDQIGHASRPLVKTKI